jgi:hypothetical protein
MSRPRTLRSKQVAATLVLLDVMAADPWVGANELMRRLAEAEVRVGRNEALAIRRAVRAVVAAAGGTGFDITARRINGPAGFRTTAEGTRETNA